MSLVREDVQMLMIKYCLIVNAEAIKKRKTARFVFYYDSTLTNERILNLIKTPILYWSHPCFFFKESGEMLRIFEPKFKCYFRN